MGDISFFVNRRSLSAAESLWNSLKSGSTNGWPLLRECRTLGIGEPVLFTLPHPDGGSIEASGRIVGLEVGKSITIAQESPWQGRTRLTVVQRDDGSDVRLDVTLGDDCLSWFLGEGSGRVPLLGGVKIGLLVCLSGSAGIHGRSIVNAATMAVEELNAMGAFGKRQAELVVADDRTSPIAAKRAYEKLVEVDRCDVVIASVSSASMDAIRPRAMTSRALLLYAALSERGPQGRNFLQFGETPRDQLWRSIPSIMSATNAGNWFILGSDYVWPRSVGMVANELISQNNGRIAGERYTALGTTNFDEVIETIASSGADLILSSLVGSDAVRFERAFYDSGKRADFRTLATLVDDSTLEHIGREAANGIWSVQDYFMPTLADEMDDAAKRYRARWGELAPRLNSLAKTTYDTCHLYAEATHAARSFEPSDVSSALRSGKIGGSRLRSRVSGLLTPTRAAEATPSGFRSIGLT